MTKRRRFTEREVIETLWMQGARIPCFRCREDLHPADAEREHLNELALGGKDEPRNCRYSHFWCHAIQTNGLPATTAGSSKAKIAKVKRISKGKMAIKKGAKKKRSAWPQRKMHSKGFVKI